MDATSSTGPAVRLISPDVKQDDKKMFMQSMLFMTSGSLEGKHEGSMSSHVQPAHGDAGGTATRENYLGDEVADDKGLQNSGEKGFQSRSSISSDVDIETYYSLESDRDNATSPDSLEDGGGGELKNVVCPIHEDDVNVELPSFIFNHPDVTLFETNSVRGDRPEVMSDIDDYSLDERPSSTESQSSWEEVQQLALNVLSPGSACFSTRPTPIDEIALADEGQSAQWMTPSSHSDSEPVDLTIKRARLSPPSDLMIREISSSSDNNLPGDTQEPPELHVDPTIDSSPSGEDWANSEEKNVGDGQPSSTECCSVDLKDQASKSVKRTLDTPTEEGEPVSTETAQCTEVVIADTLVEEFDSDISVQDVSSDEEIGEAVQGYIPQGTRDGSTLKTDHRAPESYRRTDSMGNPTSPARFFEVTNVAGTSGGVCQAHELIIQSVGYSQEFEGRSELAVGEIHTTQTDGEPCRGTAAEIQEAMKPADDYYMQIDPSEVLRQDPEFLGNEDHPRNRDQSEEQTDRFQTIRRDKVEESLQRADYHSTENVQSNKEAENISGKSVKKVSFSSPKSPMSGRMLPTFPITELHKWPSDLSSNRQTRVVEMLIEENDRTEDEHKFNGIESANYHPELQRRMSTDEAIELTSFVTADSGLTLEEDEKDLGGVDNPTFHMDETIEEKFKNADEEALPEKSSTMRSLIKETYLPRLKPNDQQLQQYADLETGASVIGESANGKAAEIPEHIAISLCDDHAGCSTNRTATTSFPVPWLMNEYFGCSCILFTIILVIVFCVVLRTYFPLHYTQHSA